MSLQDRRFLSRLHRANRVSRLMPWPSYGAPTHHHRVGQLANLWGKTHRHVPSTHCRLQTQVVRHVARPGPLVASPAALDSLAPALMTD